MITSKLKSLYQFLSPKYQTIHLEYKVDPKPRFGDKGHPQLYIIIASNNNNYKKLLEDFIQYKEVFFGINTCENEKNEDNPCWNNNYLPGLDIISLYSFVRLFKPGLYVEIGSGNSTKVARKAIIDQGLNTKIISIDPYPRANIDRLADEVIRKPLEEMGDLSFVEKLNENNILFIDNSHRCFPNSDVTVCFLELLPRLKKGVIIHIHDIYLPYDYPQFMCDRFYSEQYMLAATLLGGTEYEILMPNYYISRNKDMHSILDPIWNYKSLENVETHGGSFWMRTK